MRRRMALTEEGTVTLWALGLCVVLLFVGGFSVDLWRAFSERRALSGMADAAAVAGTSGIDEDAFRHGTLALDPARAEQLARDSLASQSDRRSFRYAQVSATPSAVTVQTKGSVELTLLRIFLHGEPLGITVTATAEPRSSR